MIRLIIFLVVYIVGFVLFYSYVKQIHSPKGKLSRSKPSLLEVVVCFIPVINLFAGVASYLFLWPVVKIKKEKKPRNYGKFFGIKQPKPEQLRSIEEITRNMIEEQRRLPQSHIPSIQNPDLEISKPQLFKIPKNKKI